MFEYRQINLFSLLLRHPFEKMMVSTNIMYYTQAKSNIKEKFERTSNLVQAYSQLQLIITSTMEPEQLIEAPEKANNKSQLKTQNYQMHSVVIPPNRVTPLKNNWEKICQTVVKNMKLQIRMNNKKKTVDVRECQETEDRAAIQRTYDFLRAFMLGFNLEDAIAMLRLDDLFLETFQIKDVKNLQGDHLSRCIARISGEKGKTKNAIQNATKTRIILADSTIHLMGSYANLRSARDSLCSLIMGTPPGKVYSQLKYVSRRLNQKF